MNFNAIHQTYHNLLKLLILLFSISKTFILLSFCFGQQTIGILPLNEQIPNLFRSVLNASHFVACKQIPSRPLTCEGQLVFSGKSKRAAPKFRIERNETRVTNVFIFT